MNGMSFMAGGLCVKYLFLLGCSLVVSTPALAQEVGEEDFVIADVPPRADTIVVTASGWGETIEQTGQSISVITSEELERVQGADLTRVLERLPGVSTARSGGLGSQTSLFVRGANSEQLLVTIDGVRVADMAAPSGGFDLGTLLTGGIARIELLRGSNSVVWGSDAIGGVLAVTSAEADGVAGSVEYGANDSLVADARAGVKGDGYAVTLNGGYARSDGISAFAGGAEPDGLRQWHLGGRARLQLAGDWALVGSGRYADSRVDFDGYPAPAYAFADTPEYQITRQASGRAGFEYGGGVLLRGGLALSSTRRAYYDPSWGTVANYETQGRSLRADLAGRADLAEGLTLDFGADSEWTRFSTSYDPARTARLASGHALLGWQRGAVSLAAGARYDDHDRFGGHWTFGANAALGLGLGWRLRASFGEGFKAPTLYQLYGYGGNAGLQPETSRAFDAGIEHGDRNAGLHVALTVFRRDSRNLIGYVWPDGYFNTGRTRAEGVELEAGAQVSERFRVQAAYSYVRATDRTSGADLARRPRQLATVSADWDSPLAGLKLGADLRLAGDSFDDAGNFVRLDGYGLVTLRASVPLGERFEVYGRIENVTDQHYQTAAGYGSYGRSAYAGVRARW